MEQIETIEAPFRVVIIYSTHTHTQTYTDR